MEAMKVSVTSKDLNLLSDQLGKDAVTRVHRLELIHIVESSFGIEVSFNSDTWYQAGSGEPTAAERVGSSYDAVLED